MPAIVERIEYDPNRSAHIALITYPDKEKSYIIYCQSGNRSEKASLIMKSLGFKVIYHYKKGYQDWVKD